MRGNAAARMGQQTIVPCCSDAELRRFLVDKYEKRRWAVPEPTEYPDLISFDDVGCDDAGHPAPGFFESFGL